jgi:hypothetical protein
MFTRLYQLINNSRLRYILLLALALRSGWYLLILLTHPGGLWLYDSNEYWNIAYNLHEYGVFSRNAEPPLMPDYFRTPLYPLFIFPTVLFDASGNSIPLFQLLLDLVTCFLLYKITLKLTGNSVYAKSAALVYALHFPALVMCSFVLSESVFIFLLTWFIWQLLVCLHRFDLRSALLLGLAGGLCVLCKPVAFVLVFPAVVFLLLAKKLNKRSLVLCACFALTFYAVQLPWMYRNKQVYGHYFNSILGEHLLYGYHTCHIYALANHIDYFEAKELLLDRAYRNISFNPYEKPYEYAKLIERESYRILWENKGLFLREHLKECIKFFIRPLRGYTRYQLGNKPYTQPVLYLTVAWQVMEQMALYLGILFYLAMVVLRKRKTHAFVFFLLALLLIFCQFNTMPYTDARMRFPFDGIIIVAAVVSWFLVRFKPPGKVLPGS